MAMKALEITKSPAQRGLINNLLGMIFLSLGDLSKARDHAEIAVVNSAKED
jgi:hypothetical protein